MTEIKMLQAILDRLTLIDSKLNEANKELKLKSDKRDLAEVEARLTKRIDKIGKQVAYLEDDSPTIKEFDKLEKRVTKIEQPEAKI